MKKLLRKKHKPYPNLNSYDYSWFAREMTEEEGYNGGCLAYGPGKGLSTSSQKSITISPNSVIDLLNKIGE